MKAIGVWLGGVIATIIVGIVVGVVVWQFTKAERVPEVDLITTAVAEPGHQVTVSGKNLDLVGEVWLIQGRGHLIPFTLVNESRLIMTIPNAVGAGEYTIEFRTSSRESVSTGQRLKIKVPPAVAVNRILERIPEVDNIYPTEVSVGQEVHITGRNLDLVIELRLAPEAGAAHKFFVGSRKIDDTHLVITMSDTIDSGEYLVELLAKNLKLITAGQRLTVQ